MAHIIETKALFCNKTSAFLITFLAKHRGLETCIITHKPIQIIHIRIIQQSRCQSEKKESNTNIIIMLTF